MGKSAFQLWFGISYRWGFIKLQSESLQQAAVKYQDLRPIGIPALVI